MKIFFSSALHVFRALTVYDVCLKIEDNNTTIWYNLSFQHKILLVYELLKKF